MGAGSTFAARRRELGREIEEVGEAVGVSRTTMYRVERDNVPQFDAHVALYFRLCDELGIDPLGLHRQKARR
jgi:DNA-binding XRE family transcriptional regulator